MYDDGPGQTNRSLCEEVGAIRLRQTAGGYRLQRQIGTTVSPWLPTAASADMQAQKVRSLDVPTIQNERLKCDNKRTGTKLGEVYQKRRTNPNATQTIDEVITVTGANLEKQHINLRCFH